MCDAEASASGAGIWPACGRPRPRFVARPAGEPRRRRGRGARNLRVGAVRPAIVLHQAHRRCAARRPECGCASTSSRGSVVPPRLSWGLPTRNGCVPGTKNASCGSERRKPILVPMRRTTSDVMRNFSYDRAFPSFRDPCAGTLPPIAPSCIQCRRVYDHFPYLRNQGPEFLERGRPAPGDGSGASAS